MLCKKYGTKTEPLRSIMDFGDNDVSVLVQYQV